MNAGTKFFLAVVALLVGVMILYYGVFQSGDHPTSALGGTTAKAPQEGPAIRSPNAPAGTTNRLVNSNRPSPTAGVSPDRNTTGGAITQIPAATDPLADLMANSTKSSEGFLSNGTQQGPGSATGSGATPNTPAGSVNPSGATQGDPSRANLTGTGTPVIGPSSITPRPSPEVKPTGVAPMVGVQPTGIKAPSSAKPTEGVEYTWYTVKEGDTGVSIAQAWFGDGNKWALVSKSNPLVDFHRLKIGQKLRLPPKDAAKAPAIEAPKANTAATTGSGKPSETTPADPNTYTVKSGDTLTSIARAKLGDGSLWELIFDANKKTIGDDPGALHVGMKLTIPAKPVKTSSVHSAAKHRAA